MGKFVRGRVSTLFKGVATGDHKCSEQTLPDSLET